MWLSKKSIKVRGYCNVMFAFMKNLPEDVVLIVSSYYGNKISKKLSNEINEQRLLYAIKEKEYFDKKLRTWHTRSSEIFLKTKQAFP